MIRKSLILAGLLVCSTITYVLNGLLSNDQGSSAYWQQPTITEEVIVPYLH